MRDNGEPDDELTNSIRNMLTSRRQFGGTLRGYLAPWWNFEFNDIEKFQQIISKSGVDFKTAFVPFNIYENYINNGQTRYINYAAAYGAFTIFKHLCANHDKIDKTTLAHAIYGGNTEIIRIVNNDQPDDDDYDGDDLKTSYTFGLPKSK